MVKLLDLAVGDGEEIALGTAVQAGRRILRDEDGCGPAVVVLDPVEQGIHSLAT